MSRLEIVPFADKHVADAAALLAARHARHREAERLLPVLDDPVAAVEAEWSQEGASGVFSRHGYLIAAPQDSFGLDWMRGSVAAHVVEGDRETARDLYAAAAQHWVDAGHTTHAVYVPSHDDELVDAWFRLSFGASSAMAMRETGPEEPFDTGVPIRLGTPEDVEDAARLELAMGESMQPSPSFSGTTLQPYEEVLAEWRDDWDDDKYVLFVAELDSRIVGHILLYRRPPDLRVPKESIDLAQASTYPEARGSGIGRALTTHVIRWAHENGYPVMTTDWRFPNLLASRFWPKRGFRTTFLRLNRSIP
jgi:GNAT superfamily N-acetyltransferase